MDGRNAAPPEIVIHLLMGGCHGVLIFVDVD